MHRVDYMTIDTEGSEALIIDDFPWRQFDVRVVQVEQLNETRFHSQAGKQEQITRRLVAEGYRLAHVIVVRRGHTEDLTFRRDFGSLACALPLAVCLSVSRGITEMVHDRIGYCSSVLVSLWFLSDS